MLEQNIEDKNSNGVNKQIIITVLFLVLILGGLFAIKSFVPKKQIEDFNYNHMKLQSSVFENGGYIPPKYTCDGINSNPSLQISDAPIGTKSLVLTLSDPDAPSGDFVHWLMWNITPETKLIKMDDLPKEFVQGKTDFGKNEYGGPCPPSGVHHYIFKLYAIDFVFDPMSPNTDKTKILTLIKDHILAKVELVGLYER